MASADCLDLARNLLQWDPSKRITASDAQEHKYLCAFLPKQRPELPEQFDWSFDGFKPTTNAVKERLYQECARFHPEIIDRDQPKTIETEREKVHLTPKSSLHGAPSAPILGRGAAIGSYVPVSNSTPQSHYRSAGTLKETPRMGGLQYAEPAQNIAAQYSSSPAHRTEKVPSRRASPSPAAALTAKTSVRSLTPVRYLTPRRVSTTCASGGHYPKPPSSARSQVLVR